jgi:hypothetical protein
MYNLQINNNGDDLSTISDNLANAKRKETLNMKIPENNPVNWEPFEWDVSDWEYDRTSHIPYWLTVWVLTLLPISVAL